MARVDDAIEVTEAVLAAHPLPDHGDGTDKFARGQVLVVGGSSETPGGVVLAAVAALRAGAGRVRVATVRSVATALAVAVPEARVTALDETAAGEVAVDGLVALTDALRRADVVLLGSGMVDVDTGGAALGALAPLVPPSTALVIDAAPLAHLGDGPHVLAGVRDRCLLLPNPGEMAHLLGQERDAVARDPLGALRTGLQTFRCALALRGGETFVGAPGTDLFVDRSGHPALATSGSGDVLAGALAGLVARGASLVDAALWAVHAHAWAGRELARHHCGLGILARELPDLLPRALATCGAV